MFRQRKCYQCKQCSKECVTDCIQCTSCKQWCHFECAGIKEFEQSKWKYKGINFYCNGCTFTSSGEYDVKNALHRICENIRQKSNRKTLYKKAEQEQLLLNIYDVHLPEFVKHTSLVGETDLTTKSILTKLQPNVLHSFSPRKAEPDGNCCYRAISLGLYGSQDCHLLLRLLTVLEILKNPKYYDTENPKYIDVINDQRVFITPFCETVQNACMIGGYAELIHIYACSAAIEKPLGVYMPSTGPSDYRSVANTKQVYGREVSSTQRSSITLMWTSTSHSNDKFVPNHFAYLQMLTTEKEQTIYLNPPTSSEDLEISSENITLSRNIIDVADVLHKNRLVKTEDLGIYDENIPHLHHFQEDGIKERKISERHQARNFSFPVSHRDIELESDSIPHRFTENKTSRNTASRAFDEKTANSNHTVGHGNTEITEEQNSISIPTIKKKNKSVENKKKIY